MKTNLARMRDIPDYFHVDVQDMNIPSLVDALAVWRSYGGEENIPVWGDLHFLDFDTRILPVMMLLDVDGAPGFGGYRYWGSQVASANARDMTGRRISDLAPPRHAEYSEEQYRWVVENAKPSLFVACLGERAWSRKYEAVLRMPCRAAADGPVDRVLSVGYYDDTRQIIEALVDIDVDLENYFDPEARDDKF